MEKIVIDPEIVKDFFHEFADAYEEVERTLILIDQSPDNVDLINRLFRVVHSIKSNLRMVAFDRLSEIVHSLENILDDIRHQRSQYVQSFNDILLIVINQIQVLARAQFQDEDIDADINKLNVAVQVLCMVEPSQLPGTIARILKQIDPDQRNEFEIEHESAPVSELTRAPNMTPIADTVSNADLEYFFELIAQLELAQPHWAGRNQRLLDLSLHMNQLADNPVDITQLTAALCLHDIGMAFMPTSILNKTEALTADEVLILRSHCYLGYEWLKRIPGWEQAALMVYQHHERLDGKGYPQGLANDAICAGARIIAIADTFEAMTSSRAHREHKRPVLRAMLEINSQSGHQFDTEWVDRFNEVIKSRRSLPA